MVATASNVLTLPTPEASNWQDAPVFNALLLHIHKGTFHKPTRRSFRFWAQLGAEVHRSPLVLSKGAEAEFHINHLIAFRYAGETMLSVNARTEARDHNNLGRVFIDLKGVTAERSSLKATIILKERDGEDLGSVDVRVDLLYHEVEPGASPMSQLKRVNRDPVQFTHAMTPAGLAKRFGFTPKDANMALSPTASDKITTEIPFKGLRVTVTIGSEWHAVAGRSVKCAVTCGRIPMRSLSSFGVTEQGHFKINLMFSHRYESDRLILLSIEAEDGTPVGDAVVDALMLIDLGIVTCVQNLQFYTRFGTIAGCCQVVFDFTYDQVECPRMYTIHTPGASPATVPAAVENSSRAGVAQEDSTPLTKPRTARDSDSFAQLKTTEEPIVAVGRMPREPSTPEVTYSEWEAPHPRRRKRLLQGDPTPSPRRSKRSDDRKAPELSSIPADVQDWELLTPREAAQARMKKAQGLMISVLRLYDFSGASRCQSAVSLGPHELQTEQMECSGKEAVVRRIISIPYAGEQSFRLRCTFTRNSQDPIVGVADIDIFAATVGRGLQEVELRDSHCEYVGRAEIWAELVGGRTDPSIAIFPQTEEYRSLMLPPSQMTALTLAEHDENRKTRDRAARLTAQRKPHETIIQTPRCLGSPSPLRVKESQWVARLEPCALSEEYHPSQAQASSVLFKIHGLRSLPDPYRCESMKVVIIARMGAASIASEPIRLNTLDPDLENCVFRIPLRGERFLQLDILEITLVRSPIHLGHFIWDALQAEEQGGVDHGFTQFEGIPTYCLHSAVFVADDCLPAYYGSKDPVPVEIVPIATESGGHSAVLNSYDDTPNAVASLVVIVRAAHNIQTRYPFSRVQISVQVDLNGLSQRSDPVCTRRCHKVPLGAYFRLPLTEGQGLGPLEFRVFAATAVSAPELIAHGALDLQQHDVDSAYSTSVEMRGMGGASQPSFLDVVLRRSDRVVRIPEVENLGHRPMTSELISITAA